MKTQLTALEKRIFVERLFTGNPEEYSVRNPFLLATYYYLDGLSTLEIAEALGVHDRTVRRYMNYFMLHRFTKRYSKLVQYHGIDGAKQISEPEYNPIGEKEIRINESW